MLKALTAFVATLMAGIATAAAAQVAAPAGPAPVSLWRLDCGSITVNDLDLFSDAYLYVGQKKRLTDSCYLIRHGSDYFLWDTGFSAELVGKPPAPGPMSASMAATLPQQLARIGVRPEQIRWVGISHRHDDHTGQLTAFPGATLLIGAGDFEKMKQGPSAARLAPWTSGGGKVEALTGDKDLFGDGSVVLLSTPGHTESHHSLLVRLKRTGPVLLTGDLYHFAENRRLGGVPGFNVSRAETMASIARFEAIAKSLNAKVVIQHEPGDVGKLAAFPAASE